MKQYLQSNMIAIMLGVAVCVLAMFGAITPQDAALVGAALTTSTAQLGNGTILKISVGSPTSFLVIGNAHDITFNNGTSAEVDVTNLTSTWKEFLLGLPDGGTVTATIDTDLGDVGQAAAYAAKNARTACDLQIILPGGTTPTAQCRGFVKKFDFNTGVDAPVRTSFEFRVTGPFTFS